MSNFRALSLLFFISSGAIIVSAGVARACPGQVTADASGTLLVEQEDYYNAPAKVRFSLIQKGKSGKLEKIPIETPGNPALIPPGLYSGMNVKIHGNKHTDKNGHSKFLLNSNPTSSELGTAIEPAPTQTVLPSGGGPRNVLLLLININGSSDVPCTDAQMDSIFFSTTTQSVATLYNLQSHGGISFVRDSNNDGAADIVRVTINNANTSTCDYSNYMSAARSAAQAKGVNLGLYNRIVYYLGAGVGACGWAGLGTVGAGYAIVNGNYCATGNGDVAAHEMGHNESMWHAALDVNDDGSQDGSDSGNEYGDTSDNMGYGGIGLRQVNCPHQVEMGWLPAANLQTVSAAGTYTLTALDLQNVSGAQCIRIARSSAVGGGYYYLAVRTNAGGLTGLPSAYTNVLNIHHHGGGGNSLYVTSKGDAQSFDASASGFSVTQLSHTATTATISISMQCTRHAPTVSISPSNYNATSAGQTAAYTVSVTNNDQNCGASTFSIGGSVPSGWGGSLSSSTVTVDSQQSAGVGMNVTPPAGTADGQYVVGAAATDQTNHSTLGAAGSATYTLDANAPAAVSNLSGTSAGGKNTLTWSKPSDGGGSGVTSYIILRNTTQIGTLSSTASSVSYVDSRPTAGTTYNYYVKAVDAVGHVSGLSNGATVTTSKKGGGKH